VVSNIFSSSHIEKERKIKKRQEINTYERAERRTRRRILSLNYS
jgi:hypothetical protein